MSNQEQQALQQKLDAVVSYGGGGGLALTSLLADIATVAQQLGIIIGCAVMAFKLYRDVEKYLQERKDKKSRK